MFAIRSLRMEISRNHTPVSIFRDISLEVPKGRFLSIVGASGCGKTTLMRCLAGLQQPTGGEILFKGEPVTGPSKGLAMVFQDYGNSLFPWKTVLGNVLFALDKSSGSKQQLRDIAMKHLESVGLAGFSAYHPWELSGGMQQRLAIARALAGGAECLLMDEPFASLDAQTRATLEDLLLKIWARGERTIIFVTHDIDEAIYLSDYVQVLGGEVTTLGDSIEIPLARPRNQLETRADPLFSQLRTAIHRNLGHKAE